MKYKVGDILQNINNSVESMITRIYKGDNTYYLSKCWESEHYLDENYELLTPHEDETETPKETGYKPWRANIAGRYFYISDGGSIYRDTESGSSIDDYRYNTGNYFETKEKAENYKEYQLAKQTLENDAKGFVPDWKSSDNKYFVYQLGNGYLGAESCVPNHGACLYFGNKKDAEESIDKHEKEWRIVFDWENGKR